jgi:hypothetical protein
MPASGYRKVNHAKSLRGVLEKSRPASTNRCRCLAPHRHKPPEMHADAALRRTASMQLLCQLKRRRLIAAVVGPHRKEDPDPNVDKRSHGHRMAFALSSFALVIGSGPRFTLRTLPGKLLRQPLVAWGRSARTATCSFGAICQRDPDSSSHWYWWRNRFLHQAASFMKRAK